MALSKQIAKKIIDVVAADPTCQRLIQPKPDVNFLMPLFPLLLRFTNLSGSFRNASMMLRGKYIGDKEFDEKICIGISLATSKVIIEAIKQGKLSEIRSSNRVHRVNWGTHHDGTWIAMKDGSTYVFDWHATLTLYDPVISKEEYWAKGGSGAHYVMFQGFN